MNSTPTILNRSRCVGLICVKRARRKPVLSKVEGAEVEGDSRGADERQPATDSPPARGGVAREAGRGGGSQPSPRIKLNNKESRELAALPGEISALEAEQTALASRASLPDYYRQPADLLRADQARNAEIEEQLIAKLERWEELEAKAKAAAT